MTEKEIIIYFAGIVDGEGCITYAKEGSNKRNYQPRLMITNTNEDLMKWLLKNFGGSYHKRSLLKYPHWKPMYLWRISGQQAMDLVKKVEPYLIIKKWQAELLDGWNVYRKECKELVSIGRTHRLSDDYLDGLDLLIGALKLANQKGIKT